MDNLEDDTCCPNCGSGTNGSLCDECAEALAEADGVCPGCGQECDDDLCEDCAEDLGEEPSEEEEE